MGYCTTTLADSSHLLCLMRNIKWIQSLGCQALRHDAGGNGKNISPTALPPSAERKENSRGVKEALLASMEKTAEKAIDYNRLETEFLR